MINATNNDNNNNDNNNSSNKAGFPFGASAPFCQNGVPVRSVAPFCGSDIAARSVCAVFPRGGFDGELSRESAARSPSQTPIVKNSFVGRRW